MIRGRWLLATVMLSMLPGTSAIIAQTDAISVYREALAAQKSEDWAAYRARMEQLVTLVPDAARLQLRLAGARARAGDREGAIGALEAQIDAGLFRAELDRDADLVSLRDLPRWQEIVKKHRDLLTPLVRSTEVVRLSQGDALIEGIAVHPADGSLLLSSVRHREVLRVASDGTVSRFLGAGAHGLAAPLALGIDRPRGLLWIVSAGLPQAQGIAEDERDRSRLLAIDLAQGTLRKSLESGSGKHLWNDLVLADDGTIYLSDPGAGSLARVDPDGKVTSLAEGQGLRSPGGLALSADGSLLYVADWSQGLALVELASGRLSWLAPPAGTTLLGIDGLLRVDESLVAIQNGIEPARIVRLALAPDGRSLRSGELLERAVPDWLEPTLGVVDGDALLYVGASQWPSFGADGEPLDDAPRPGASIRRLPLR